jgi:uncharacterized phage protein gp47/JayE
VTTSYATLTTPVTQAAYLSQILATLAAQGFPVTGWQSGNAGRTLAVADAAALTDLRAVIADVARGGYLDTATGDWLTLLAAGLFDLTRTPAVFAVGSVTLACVATAGPYSITAGALVVTDGTRRWRSTNTTTQTLPSSGSLVVNVRAESPGTAYNVSGSTLLTTPVSPSLAGVTVTAATAWLTTSGAAEESDASLRARCRARWGTLGRGANDSAYVYWARTGHSAVSQVTRAAVVWGAGDGKLTVYLAGPSGTVSSGVVAIVDAWIDANKPGTDDPTVASATARVVALIATVTVDTASDSTANRALATDALAAYFASLDIGEDVDLGRLYEAFYAAAGVLDVDITQPATDTSVNNDEIATLSATITWATA